VTAQLGYQTTDLLKKPLSEFCIAQDQQTVKDQLKSIFETKQTQPVQMTIHMIPNSAAFANENQPPQEPIPFKSSAYAFLNPCNDTFEFIVCTHVNQNRLNDISNTANSNTLSSNHSINVYNNSSRMNNSVPLLTNSSNSASSTNQMTHMTSHQTGMHHHHQQPQMHQQMHHQMDHMQSYHAAPYQHLNTYNIIQQQPTSGSYHMATGEDVNASTGMAMMNQQMSDPATNGSAPFYPSTIGSYLGKY
jgi:hypothetical protein